MASPPGVRTLLRAHDQWLAEGFSYRAAYDDPSNAAMIEAAERCRSKYPFVLYCKARTVLAQLEAALLPQPVHRERAVRLSCRGKADGGELGDR